MDESDKLQRFVARHALTWADEPAWKTVAGTLCLVDISGFTRLSERLAASGRVGAEELTEVLNRVFGAMLDIARLRRGELLKFGGDALLLLFEGEDHAMQAASAAVEMRAALGKAVEVPTSVGRMALRMSVGVHSGRVHLFKARGTHIELIVAGPSASMVAEIEGTASAGEIVISAATRDLLPEGSATSPKGGGWLLRWRKARVEPCGAAKPIQVESTAISQNIPTALRSHLSSKRLDSEHRLAAVAFVEIVGVDDLLAQTDPDVVCGALNELVDSVTAIVDEEGVTFLATDVEANGGKIILVSGVPTTQIDECGRILRAARRIADLDSPFGLKIGVNRGHVFAGEIGTDHRSTFTVMGDTVNLAARLMAAAPQESIYATPDLLEESLTVFESKELDPISVKGKEKPVRVSVVGEEVGSRGRDSAELLPFTGRDAELTTVLACLERIKQGHGGAVSVTGPTGIGKTRLVDEALEEVGTDVYVMEVRAEPYGAASPYRPFRDEVRRILSVERGTNEEMSDSLISTLTEYAPAFVPYAPLIGDVAHIVVPDTSETENIDAQFRQARVADIVVDLMHAWTDEPFVIVAEDVHWADPASVSLLERLAREADARSWVVIMTSRDEIETDASTRIELEPLDPEATSELIYAATESSPLRRDQVAAIALRSGGNPLFTQELLKVVEDTGDASSLPTSLDGVVGSQIDALEPNARRALRYVSILGRSFRIEVARELIATQGVELTDAVRATLNDFLDDDGSDRLRFHHALVRDVAYEGLPYRRRRDLHIRAGHLIKKGARGAEEGVLDVLSLHFFLGGDREQAWTYSRRAGLRNMGAYANVEAETEFTRAIDAARRLESVDRDDLRDVWIDLGDVRERSGKFSESLDAYRHATRLTGDDPVVRAEVLLRRARAKERSGAYSSALSEATRARRLCEGLDSDDAMRTVAKALRLTAMIRQAQQRPRLAIAAAQKAAEAAEAAGDRIALAGAWKVMDYAYVMLGRLDLAVNSVRSLEIFQEYGDLLDVASVSVNLGALRYWNGEWAEALDYYERGREAAMETGNMLEAAGAAANIGEVLVNQGRYRDAEDPLRAARREYSASGFTEGVGFVDLLIGRMYGIDGRIIESIDWLERAIEELTALDLRGSILEAEIHLADARCRAGSPSSGLDLLKSAESSAPPDHMDYYRPLMLRTRGSILDSAGRTEEAVVALSDGMAVSRERGDEFEYGLTVLTLARVAEEQVDPAVVDEARRTLHSLGVVSAPGISLGS